MDWDARIVSNDFHNQLITSRKYALHPCCDCFADAEGAGLHRVEDQPSDWFEAAAGAAAAFAHAHQHDDGAAMLSAALSTSGDYDMQPAVPAARQEGAPVHPRGPASPGAHERHPVPVEGHAVQADAHHHPVRLMRSRARAEGCGGGCSGGSVRSLAHRRGQVSVSFSRKSCAVTDNNVGRGRSAPRWES